MIRSRFTRVLPPVVMALAVSWPHAAEPRTMTGIYVAGDGKYPDSGNVTAMCTPAGDDTWDVVFQFDFQEDDYTFRGSADGNLSDGLLEGRVKSENGKRTFTFTGLFVDGVFRGTHAEVEHGGETPTGTITLEAQE